MVTDEKAGAKKRIVQLSLKHQILSPHTASVGVERRQNGSNGDMVLREVPIQISADDQDVKIHQTTTSYSAVPHTRMMWDDCFMSDCLVASPGYYNQSSNACSFPTMNDNDGLFELPQPIAPTNTIDFFDSPWAFSENLPQKQTIVSGIIDLTSTGDEDIVRYLIKEQKFDGRWDLDGSLIQQLTGKRLASFSSSADPQLLLSTIIIVTLETRFALLSTLWFGVVQKARKRLRWILWASIRNDSIHYWTMSSNNSEAFFFFFIYQTRESLKTLPLL